VKLDRRVDVVGSVHDAPKDVPASGIEKPEDVRLREVGFVFQSKHGPEGRVSESDVQSPSTNHRNSFRDFIVEESKHFWSSVDLSLLLFRLL
jgi:hypothetical protein